MDGQQQQQPCQRPAPYPVQPGSQQSSNGSNSPHMEGFGSADITSPFNYGSVNDGRYRQDSLEQKLRRKYWKTKQTVIEKLGKNQDEFVVASDADIDMKLEKAFHLQSSCDQLLSALDKYIARIRAASVHEKIMGEHLRTWSETEYTNAGEVMQNVGKIQEGDAKKRLSIEASLQRMQSEFMVFRVTAIRDLGLSIQHLQKARTEYRAALLWMKDVSEKLQNPDYRNQLFKFREAQVAVKESKKRYEKLKFDLGEKIDMVSASRCNLLSRSLPYYQKEILSFYDDAANEFHKILVDLRSHHHHQYKVRRLAEEIRDLEAEESPFSDESGLLGTSGSLDDDVPLLDIGAGGSAPGADGANEEGASGKKSTTKEAPPTRMLGSDQLSIEKIQEEAKVKDLALSGIEAELRELQKEVLQPSANDEGLPPSSTSPKPSQSDQSEATTAKVSADKDEPDEFRDLLQLDDATTDEPPLQAPQSSQDKLFDDWSSFSAFMPTSLERTKSPTSGWEKELLSGSSEDDTLMGLESKEGSLSPTQVPPPLSSQAGEGGASTTDKSLAEKQDQTDSSASAVTERGGDGSNGKLQKASKGTKTGESEPGSSSDLLSEDLKALGISPETAPTSTALPKPTLGPDMESLDPSYFSQQQPPPPTYQQQQLLKPTITTGAPQQLPIMPPPPILSGSTNMMAMVPVAGTSASAGQEQQQSPAVFRSPQSNSQRPILAAALASSHPMISGGVGGAAGYPMMSSLGGGGIGGGANKMGATGGGTSPTKAKANGRHVSEKDKDKSASWMNVFAHLDPLVNEKV